MSRPALLPLHNSVVVKGSGKEGFGGRARLGIRKSGFWYCSATHWLHELGQQPVHTSITWPALLQWNYLIRSSFPLLYSKLDGSGHDHATLIPETTVPNSSSHLHCPPPLHFSQYCGNVLSQMQSPHVTLLPPTLQWFLITIKTKVYKTHHDLL